MKKAIIYLHGFNSASLDLSGALLVSKQKLLVLDHFCKKEQIKFCSPNVDYRNFEQVIAYLGQLSAILNSKGYEVLFMGSSLGGFTSEYMAIKNQTKVIMINPAILPSELLLQFVGVTENFEIQQDFDWTKAHCEQYKVYESELAKPQSRIERTVLVDMADELLDSSKTVEKYKGIANVVCYAGGSHSFEHIEQALTVIKKVIDG